MNQPLIKPTPAPFSVSQRTLSAGEGLPCALEIDGAQGEGGGQILRSALSLSVLTATPIRLRNIRAGRAKPGLMRQHLMCVQAAKQISGADAVGAELGSTELQFTPHALCGGSHHFKIGGAGSTLLVLQTLLPPLLAAAQSARVTIEGGTHNMLAPSAAYFVRVFLPQLRAMGANIRFELVTPGLAPAGGGKLVCEIEPQIYVDDAGQPRALRPLQLLERGMRQGIYSEAIVAGVPIHVAGRENAVLAEHYRMPAGHGAVLALGQSTGPGNVLSLWSDFEHVSELVTVYGSRGTPAETVAQRACGELDAYLKQAAPVGEHLSDQLLLPLWLAGAGEFITATCSEHLRSNMLLINQFAAQVGRPLFQCEALPKGFRVSLAER